MTEQQKQLRADVPADAAQILDHFIGNMKMDGLRGSEVAVVITAVQTVLKTLVPTQDAK